MHDTLAIFGAEYLIGIIALFFLLYFFLAHRRGHQRFLVLSAISLPLAYVLGKLAGWWYFNPRPFVSDNITPLVIHVANNGFPSDHTLLSMSLAAVVFVFNRGLGLFLFVLALLVGMSRVFVGVHHWVDIAGGAAIAIIAVYGTYVVLRRTHWWRG